MVSIRDLQKLGLMDKEAAVYVAALGLGSGSVQDIAKAARIKRPTAYLAIDSLIQKGLMSSVENNGRRVFAAESPDRLAALYASWAKEISTKEQTFKELLPELLALTSGAEEKPRVLFYEGLDGLETMRDVFLKTKAREMVSFFAMDEYRASVPPALREKHKERLFEMGIGGRVIYSTKRDDTSRVLPKAQSQWQVLRVPVLMYPFAGEVAVLGERVAILSYDPQPLGVIIHSSRVALMLRAIFNLAWATAVALAQK